MNSKVQSLNSQEIADKIKSYINKYKSDGHTGKLTFEINLLNGGITNFHCHIGVDLRTEILKNREKH